MKLYTRSGDQGTTGLFGGQRVSKASARVIAYGEVDELNSALGVARTHELWPELDQLLIRIQHELFDLGSHLATPQQSASAAKLPPLTQAMIEALEHEIDRATAAVPPLTAFILPSGSGLGAWLLYVRCICRRAERECVAAGQSEEIPALAITYLNRLSDLLFALGREANQRAGVAETVWQAGASNSANSQDSASSSKESGSEA